METIIGFVAGYLTGTKDGRAGRDRARKSLRDIVNSAEARRMARQAVAVAGSMAGRRSARGASATATGLARLVIRQVSEATADKETPRAA
jgi:gas vesicle protein